MSVESIEVYEAGGSQPKSVLALRQISGRAAIGILAHASSSVAPPHAEAAAGASAWLALGQHWHGASDCERAVDCAASGLAELRDDYLGPDPAIVDDTEMKLLAAEDLRVQGRVCDAAGLMLRILGTRVKLYAAAHQDHIAGLDAVHVKILQDSRLNLWQPIRGVETATHS